jgi:glycerol kinase
MRTPLILAIDQGTTSTRAVVYDAATFQELGSAQKEFTQHYPRPGWVEHDAEEIWQSVTQVVPAALLKANRASDQIAGIGITNQRETVVLWERSSGRPLAKAIVWQDRRTTDFCREHASDQQWLQKKTGLVLDPYFSATKVRWLLEQDQSLRARAERGEIACGTIDSFLMWRLTGGQSHVTDLTNASRTLLLDIHTLAWDDELLRYFGVPRAMLPDVKPSAATFGTTKGHGFIPDGISICGVAGDQQAALFGQCAFAAGEAKCTYGTGAFFLLHTGDRVVPSKHQLVSTVAAMTSPQPRYALEGSVFVAGAAVQWLRDGLKMFAQSADVEALAGRSNPQEPVIFVPAFVGLGAPWWDAQARGAIYGLTRKSGVAELARAALEAVGYQTRDLLEAMHADWPASGASSVLRVDGGMAASDATMQFLADILALPVDRPAVMETTALGAAYLAGRAAGLCPDLADFAATWQRERRFEPQMDAATREHKWAGWRDAVARTLSRV